MKRKVLFLILTFLVSTLTIQTAEAGTSLSKAKSLIRSLYYGQQQASQRSLSAENSYILSHNYPGMYSNPRQCLSTLTQNGIGYGPGIPDLASVDFDSTWTIPTGLPGNKLSGKKPKGDTFVVDVNWSGRISTNHVTILKGKAYYYLWICGS